MTRSAPRLPDAFDNEWCDFRCLGSDTLLVTFSPINVAPGLFSPFKAIERLDYDILRFNGPNSQWYIGGIPTTDDGEDTFERLIGQFISSRGYERVALLGASKGGFAALDFGLRIPCQAIIAAGAETLMGLKGAYATNWVCEERLARGRRRIAEWPTLVQNCKAKKLILYGGRTLVDRLLAAWAWKMLHEPPKIIACDHQVFVHLNKTIGLATVVSSMMANGGFDVARDDLMAIDPADFLARAEARFAQLAR